MGRMVGWDMGFIPRQNLHVYICVCYSATAVGRAAFAAGADVYVSNGHKWFFAPKGAAFLWVSKQLQGASDPYAPPGEAVYPCVSACWTSSSYSTLSRRAGRHLLGPK